MNGLIVKKRATKWDREQSMLKLLRVSCIFVWTPNREEEKGGKHIDLGLLPIDRAVLAQKLYHG